MPYDTFVIYFLFFPTLTLVLGVLISHPTKVIWNFLLSAISTSFFLVLYCFLLESLLINSSTKIPNLYFNNTWRLGSVSFLQLSYYFLVPWFIGSLCLLVDRIPNTKEKKREQQNYKIKLKTFLWGINSLLLLDLVILYLSLEFPDWYEFRLLCVNLLWILPSFNVFLYFRAQKNFYYLCEINCAGILAGLYTFLGSLFITEPLYLYDWYSLSPALENTLFIMLTFFMAAEMLVIFSCLWHTKVPPKKDCDSYQSEEWFYPFLSSISLEENELGNPK